MVIKVFVSGVSASQEVRKKQQKVLFILDTLRVDHEVVDITEPGREDDKTFMRDECLKSGKSSHLPPQLFSDQDYLGDYDDFEVATENETLPPFLRLINHETNEQSSQNEEVKEALSSQGEPGLVNGILENKHLDEGRREGGEGNPEGQNELVDHNSAEDEEE